MPLTKFMPYHRWRIKFKLKGFSKIGTTLDQSFQEKQLLSKLDGDVFFGNSDETEQRGEMLGMLKKDGVKEMKQLVSEMKKMCKKESIFRKDKVEEIKNLIKSKQYNISGKRVVDKWFPEESAI